MATAQAFLGIRRGQLPLAHGPTKAHAFCPSLGLLSKTQVPTQMLCPLRESSQLFCLSLLQVPLLGTSCLGGGKHPTHSQL